MNFTKEQSVVIKNLKENSNKILSYTQDLISLERTGLKDSWEYTCLLNDYKRTLLKRNDILNSEEFKNIDFIIEFRELINTNLQNVDAKERIIASRIIGELESKMYSSAVNYDRDIFMIALCLIDNYIVNNPNGPLELNLMAYKYGLAVMSFNITCECLDRRFDFKDDLYVFSEIITEINQDTQFADYSLNEYVEQLFIMYANELLCHKDEDYCDVDKSCFALEAFFLIESIVLFIEQELTWDYCEEKLNVDENNIISINLLKKAIQSKSETRKRIKFVSFAQ